MHGGKKQIFACEWISPLAWKAAVASGIDMKLPRREEQIIHSLFCCLSEAVSQRLLVGAPQELCISPGTLHFSKPRLRSKLHDWAPSLLGAPAISMEAKTEKIILMSAC